MLGGHHGLIEQLCMTKTNIPTFFISLFISMQHVCLHMFGCEWHAEMKAADTTKAQIGCFFKCPPPLLPLLFSLEIFEV